MVVGVGPVEGRDTLRYPIHLVGPVGEWFGRDPQRFALVLLRLVRTYVFVELTSDPIFAGVVSRPLLLLNRLPSILVLWAGRPPGLARPVRPVAVPAAAGGRIPAPASVLATVTLAPPRVPCVVALLWLLVGVDGWWRWGRALDRGFGRRARAHHGGPAAPGGLGRGD